MGNDTLEVGQFAYPGRKGDGQPRTPRPVHTPMTSHRARPGRVLRLLTLLAVSLLARPAPGQKPPPPPPSRELWLYYPTNLLVEKNLDKAREVWTRAAKAGYTHVLLADSKFSRLPDMDKRYFDHCERIKRL